MMIIDYEEIFVSKFKDKWPPVSPLMTCYALYSAFFFPWLRLPALFNLILCIFATDSFW